jgi:phosphohistidine phosphatase
MLIYLVRHGIAMDREDPACPPDPERRLTEKGIAKTREVARGAMELGVEPNLFISSPYLRALQTAEVFAQEFGYDKGKIRKLDALKPAAAPAVFFRELNRLGGAERNEIESVICFGHAPNLDLVIAAAVGTAGAFTELKKSGVACLEMERLAPPHGILLWLATPKLLRSLAE